MSLYLPRKMREVYEICIKLNFSAFCFAVLGYKCFDGKAYV